MTPAELEQLVMSGDPDKLAAAVAPLSEEERQRLSAAASELRRRIDRLGRSQGRPDDKLTTMAELALLAVSRVPRVPAHPCATKILRDRRPEWIDEWIEEILAEDFPEIRWEILRELMRYGVIKKPTADGYVRLMVPGLPDRWHAEGYRPLSRKLLANPDLLEREVWLLFKVETDAFSVDQSENNPHAPANYESWLAAVVRLAEEGRLERARLLDEALEALIGEFKKSTLSGFLKLHDALKPSLDELAARQQKYLDLLTSPVVHVITFALEKLKDLEEGSRLQAQSFLESIGRVFAARSKTQPRAALGLIERVVKREPHLAAKGSRLAAGALTHYSPHVQERALELLEGWVDRLDPTLGSMLADQTRQVAHKLRERLSELVERVDASPSAESSAVATFDPSVRGTKKARPDGDSGIGSAAAAPDLDSLDDELRSSAPGASELTRPSMRPPSTEAPRPRTFEFDDRNSVPLDVSAMHAPARSDAAGQSGQRLGPELARAAPVVPIATIDELIAEVARAVEGVESAMQVERILDGISRLCDQRPDGFEERTAALLQRITEEGGSEETGLLRSWGVPRALSVVVMTWLVQGRPRVTPDPNNPERGARKAITGRLLELARRVVRGVAAPMLAAPTHEGGWIDPRRLVERILKLQKAEIPVPRIDLVQALLRLAPGGRPNALIDAKVMTGATGRIVRWALGGEAHHSRDNRPDAPLWVAAGRARSPYGSLEELSVLGVSERAPDALRPATYSWKVTEDATPPLSIETEPRGTTVRPDEYPCTALHEPASEYSVHGVQNEWLIDWISMLWPANQDAVFVAGATTMSRCLDVMKSSFEPGAPFLNPLREPWRPWTDMALLTEWLALASRNTDTRRAAIETLLAGIENERVQPSALADVLLRLNATGWIKLDRVSSAFREVARASRAAESFVALTLDHVVAAFESLPRDAHHLLSLLHKLLSAAGSRPSLGALDTLRMMHGSSKTNAVIRKLLDLSPQRDMAR